MIHERVRLIGLALIVFLIVPYIVLRQLDKAEQSKESMEGKVQIVHYWGIPQVATRVEDQVLIAIYKRFLDRPENQDVVVKAFSGLEIRDLPSSWDAMMQMAFAADRAPDILQLVTENIQTHREEQFVRPLPDSFTFEYSNAAYDDDSGFVSQAIAEIRKERAAQQKIFADAKAAARQQNLRESQWLPQAAFNFDLAMMRAVQRNSTPGHLLPRSEGEPHLIGLLGAWNDLMRRSDQRQFATADPDAELIGEPISGQLAWNRWLFEKLQSKIPADLLRALYEMEPVVDGQLTTGRLYGADEGEPGLMALQYRLKPFREASLVDRSGRPVLPQSWDELEYWSMAVSLLGDGLTTDGKVGYAMSHGQLIPYPFPLYAYGAGGLMVTQNQAGSWSCALDSPGTVRGMGWIRHMAFLRPVKIDYRPAGSDTVYPLVVVYSQKSWLLSVPQFFLRSVQSDEQPEIGGRYDEQAPAPGEAQQVVIRRLTLTDDWRVLDAGRELFRFAGRQDLIDRLKDKVSQSPGQCSPTRPMDKGDLTTKQRMWDEDTLAMTYSARRTLVVPNPEAEGVTRHPDGPAWDIKVTERDLAGPGELADLQARLAARGIKADLAVSGTDWPAVADYMQRLARIKDAQERKAVKANPPAPLARLLAELARVSMPADLYYPNPGLAPARPSWADNTEIDRDRSGVWTWVHLVSPDGATVVTVQDKYVKERQEYEAWPGGPRFVAAPVTAADSRYVQFLCGLQSPADQVRRLTTYRLQVAVVDMGLLALNHRLNEDSPAERDRLEAAIRLISYLSSDEAEKIAVDTQVKNGLGPTVNPVLLRKYGYDEEANKIPSDYEEMMRNIRRIGRAVPPVPNYRGFQQFLANLGDRVVIEGEDPAQACRVVTATVNKRFLTDPDPEVMVRRRKAAFVVFAIVVLSLLTAAVWMGRQLFRGVSAHVNKNDIDLGSVGQRPTWKTHMVAWLFLGPAVLTVLIWSYLPLGWGSVMAFQDFHVVKPTSFVGLDNFIRIFVDPQFYYILGNTLYFVFLTLSLGFLAPIMLALMLHEIPWGKIFYRTVFYLPAITSGLVILFMWKRFYDPRKDGLLNTLLTGMNDFPDEVTFGLKLVGLLALPTIALILYNLPLLDEMESRVGRFIASLLPISLTLWLGYRAPGSPLSLPASWNVATVGGIPMATLGYAALLAVALIAALLLLRAAFKSEHEFSSRRIPWAAPAVALIFTAGWLLRHALVAIWPTSAAVSPQSGGAHIAQMFVLCLPLLGAWPVLRLIFGKEHQVRETMYLVLRDKGQPLAVYSRPARLACAAAGAVMAAVAVVALFVNGSPVQMAYRYLIGPAAGWMLHPLVWQSAVAVVVALLLARRPRLAAAGVGGLLAAVILANLLPEGGALRMQLLGQGKGWLLQPFFMEPLLWLKDRDLAMLCIILPGVWAHMGPGCLIYLAGLKSIPEEVYEAADLDGAGAFQKAWTITMPHLMALLIINFVGAFIAAFQTSQNVLVMTAGGPADATMVLGLQVWLDAFVLLKFGYATALAWILGLMLIGFTMYQISILKKVQFKTSGMK